MHVQPWMIRVLTSNQINAGEWEGGADALGWVRGHIKNQWQWLRESPSFPSKVLMSLHLLFPNIWRQAPLLRAPAPKN